MRIIIVDDQPGLANTFALSLRAHRHTALPFTNGAEALEAIQSDDILITDYNMPEMTGLELAEKAYQRGWRGNLFIMSGNSATFRDTLVHPLLQAILQKPLGSQELHDALFPPSQTGGTNQ